MSEIFIEQGYLTTDKKNAASVRIRHSQKNKSTWMMTIKQDTLNRVVEVEKKLSERDARDLWACCHSKLRKVRHHVPDKKGLTWEIDIFLKEDVEFNTLNRYHIPESSVYCVLAEIELPENAPRPNNLPSFLRSSLLYEVPLGDGRFSNKKLWNAGHADELYRSLEPRRVP